MRNLTLLKNILDIKSHKVLRSLSNNSTSTAISEDTTKKCYEEIPSVPYRSWPFIGQGLAFARKPHGLEQSWKNLKIDLEKYSNQEMKMIRYHMPALNPNNDGRVLFITDPNDVEVVYRNEGKYPYRGEGFAVLKLMRSRRPDLFGETLGIVLEEGKKWQDIRSKVQQDLMRPKSAFFYIEELTEVADELVGKIRRERNSDFVNKKDFLEVMHYYAFESTTIVAIDTKMGCLQENPDPIIMKKLEKAQILINVFAKLALGVPIWRISPALDPTFRMGEIAFSDYADYVRDKINEATKQIEEKYDSIQKGEAANHEISILEKMIIKNGPSSPIPFVMAFDMVVAGVDTTGNTSAFLTYHLARNTDKQEKLRREVLEYGENPTEQNLGKMKYFRACLRESLRLTSTIPSNGRILDRDIILKDHNVPAGTFIMWNWEVMGRDLTYFPEPEKFIPERWLDKEKDKIHPFSSLQFSRGPRMCIGKRFAELEIQLLFYKLLRNFKIEWAGQGNMETKWTFVNVPDTPLKFKFLDL